MVTVRFPSMRLVEYPNPRAYVLSVSRWLELREAENCYILGSLSDLTSRADQNGTAHTRMFAVEDGQQVVAAALLYGNGCLALTWASPEIINVFIDGLHRAGCQLTSTFGPSHTAEQLAALWAQRTGQTAEYGRMERIYQLVHPTYVLPPSGRLEAATQADADLVLVWLKDFAREAKLESADLTTVRDSLIPNQQLFLWKNPEPVSMAAWLAPTPNGGCINLVYTPPELRHKGHASSAVTALGRHMLAQGRRYCFILADPDDHRLHVLYQRLGARTLCEHQRCIIKPAATGFNVAVAQRNQMAASA